MGGAPVKKGKTERRSETSCSSLETQKRIKMTKIEKRAKKGRRQIVGFSRT